MNGTGEVDLPEPLAIDTDILIYFMEDGSPERKAFLRAGGIGEGHPVIISALTLAECLVGRWREPSPSGVNAFRDAILELPGFTMVPETTAIVSTAARIRGLYRHALPDAVHLATAIEHGAAAFLTNDDTLRRRAAGLPIDILVLDDLIADAASGEV
jgi:predicted nucleic acid-binding protein